VEIFLNFKTVIMKTSKFNPTQIAKILKEFESGKDVDSIIREHGISKATFYKWRQRYGGMEASELKRVKQLKCQAQTNVC
jgi:putative transposase